MPSIKRLSGAVETVPDTELSMGPKYATADIAIAAMIGWVNVLTAQVLGRYPQAVVELWSEEERMARALLSDPPTASVSEQDKLNRDALAKGRTMAEQAAKILENADRFREIGEEVRALFLATETALRNATDPADHETILDAAKAQAIPLATQYGLTI